MVHFLESGKRGGMSIIGTRHLTPSPSEKCKPSGKKPRKREEEDSEIIYIDANVLFFFSKINLKLESGILN
jgi:hypothetical protein